MPCFNERATVEQRRRPGPGLAVDGRAGRRRRRLDRRHRRGRSTASTDERVRVYPPRRATAGKGAALRTRVRRRHGRVRDRPGRRPRVRPGATTARCSSRSSPARPTSCSAPGSCPGGPHRVLYFWHSLGNRLLTLLSNMFTDLNLTDMETCYKAFRREVLEQIAIEEDRFGVEPELTAKVARGGWRIYEVGHRLRRPHLRRGQEDRLARRPAGARVHRALLRGRSAAALVGARAAAQAASPPRPPGDHVAQAPAGDQQHRLGDDPARHLRRPGLAVGEHDRRLHHPVPGPHEAADELGEEGVALGVGRGRLDRPQRARRGRPGSPTCSRAPAGRGRTTCSGCPTATAGGGAAASRRWRRRARSASRSRRRRRRR